MFVLFNSMILLVTNFYETTNDRNAAYVYIEISLMCVMCLYCPLVDKLIY